MEKNSEKKFLHNRKTVFYLVVAFSGILLFSSQTWIASRRLKNPDFNVFPVSLLEKMSGGFRERSDEIEKMHKEGEKKIEESYKLDEEIIKELKKKEKKINKEKNAEEKEQ